LQLVCAQRRSLVVSLAMLDVYPTERLSSLPSGYQIGVMVQRACGLQSRIVVTLALALMTSWGCSHPQDLSSSLRAQMAPFAQTRAQAIAVVKIAKKNLDPGSINQVNVKYAALQVDANEYLGFIAESVQVAGFDQARNQRSSTELNKTIDGFNGSVGPVVNPLKTRPGVTSIPLPLQGQWVAELSTSLTTDWQNYHTQLSAMAPQDRMTLAQQLKADYVWPSFQDIATEKLPLPLASPSPGGH
jgi:hypothetical protein